MRAHHIITDKLMQASQDGRCLSASDAAEGKALRRRVQAGEVVSPYRGMFADADYWNALNATEQARHVARALAERRPLWVFAGPTAAALHGFEHQWSIHRSGLYVASTSTTGNSAGGVHRVYMASVPAVDVGGLRATSAARTLVDCALILPFASALPIFDSAIARDAGLADEVLAICAGLHRDTSAVDLLLTYANPLSENGGESFVRGVILEEGLPVPMLQYVFVNPDNPREWYRSDFVWIFPGGYTVVLEFDGMAKYVDPTMTDGRTIRAVVNSQSERERVIYACGADRIVRTTFEEALQRRPLVDKLVGAGLPRNPRTETGAPPAIPFLVAGQQWDERLRQSWMRSFHAAS